MEETDAKHKTMIIGMKVIEWNEQFTLKDDERWYKAVKDMDLNMRDDDYTDDMYYDSADEAGIADDDKYAEMRVGDKKRVDEADKEKVAEQEHVVHHHHHGEEYLKEAELLDMEAPEPIEPPSALKAHIEKIKKGAVAKQE